MTRRFPLAAVARHPWLTALALLLLAIGVLIVLWDWNWFKGPIERQVQARDRAQLRHRRQSRRRPRAGITDDPRRCAALRQCAVVEGADDGAAPIASSSSIELWPLLFHREVRIPDIRLTKPRLRLETGPQGIGNWVFGEPGGMQPQFRRLWIDDGQPAFPRRARARPTSMSRCRQQTAQGKDDRGAADRRRRRRSLAGQSVHRAGPRRIAAGTAQQGRGPTASTRMRRPARPARMRAARCSIRCGCATSTCKLALSGKDMDDLYPLIGIATPQTPPYALDGRLTRDVKGDRTTWHYDDFKGVVGDSDLAGDASVDHRRHATVPARQPRLQTAGFRRPRRLHRRRAADRVAARRPIRDQTQQAARQAARPQAAAGHALRTGQAARDGCRRALEGAPHQRAQAAARRHGRAPAAGRRRAAAGAAELRRGRRRHPLRPSAWTRAKTPIRTRADIAARGLNLRKLLPDVKLAQDAIGKVGGHVALSGHGNSIAQMLGSGRRRRRDRHGPAARSATC